MVSLRFFSVMVHLHMMSTAYMLDTEVKPNTSAALPEEPVLPLVTEHIHSSSNYLIPPSPHSVHENRMHAEVKPDTSAALPLVTEHIHSSSMCPEHFEKHGSYCYYFSDYMEPWERAVGACEGIDHLLGVNGTLAMLDMGDDPEDQNQKLLTAIKHKGCSYWLGASAPAGSLEYTWLDGRPLNPVSSYFHRMQPNTTGACIKAAVTGQNIPRTYIYSENCSAQMYLICQSDVIGKSHCPPNFEDIFGTCHMFSVTLGTGPMSWSAARAFCKNLTVPDGTEADLAMLDMQGHHNQGLFQKIIRKGMVHTWLGGEAKPNGDFHWLDGRLVKLDAYYWESSNPNADPRLHRYLQASIRTELGHSRVKVADSSDRKMHFVCQLTNI